MKPLEEYDDATWDRFFDFLADGVAELSDAEVREALADAGIDTTAAHDRPRTLIQERCNR
jgi:hypothetical protein